MRHEPSVSAQNPDLHLIFSLQFLLLLSQSIDKYYSKPTSELPACMCAKEASTCPLLHRRGAIDLADFRQSIAGLLFLLFHIFFSSHVYLLSFTPLLLLSQQQSNVIDWSRATQHVEERCMYHAAVFGADGEFAAVIGFQNSLQIKNFPLFFSLEEKKILFLLLCVTIFAKEKFQIKVFRSSKKIFKAFNQRQRFYYRRARDLSYL